MPKLRAASLCVAITLAVTVVAQGGHPATAATPTTQNFDGLAAQLQPSLDENIADSTLGWTRATPQGWTITTKSQMPDGMREWRGWTFTTMPFWTAADGQDRAGFTRASGVLAVADPDEWDDRGTPTTTSTFDSTLTSAPIPIAAGQQTLHIGFASHYRQEGNQKAEAVVHFSGPGQTGLATTFLTYGPGSPDAQNTYIRRGVAVPPGMTSATLAWRLYDAGNNWYWAIDDVKTADQPFYAPPVPVPNPVAAPTLANGVSTDKLLVIGIDGLRWDKISPADAPNLRSLIDGGLFGTSLLPTSPMAGTWSGPGWSTIASGVWPDKHGVKDNSFSGKNYGTYPDFLTRMEQARPSLSTYAAVDWAPLGSHGTFGAAIDGRVVLNGDSGGWTAEDARVAEVTARVLRDQNPDAAFAYLGEVDIAGHNSGASSQAYTTALARVDDHVGTMLGAIAARANRAGERWLVLVATDHGHLDCCGHGGSSIRERETFVLANGHGVAAGQRPIDTRQTDIAVTALDHLNVTVDKTWGLDGRSLLAPRGDDFDAAYGALSTRVNESGIPATVKGFTHTGVNGWTIDTSAMPAGGVAEWRGWALTTDEFWTRAEADQWRELGVRGRGVIAVADSDEWSDITTGAGSFDSSLTSPPYDVTGRGGVSLTYTTHYRQEGAQKGDVLVSFDGGPFTAVKSYRSDAIAKDEDLSLAVPAGATSMRVRFRMYDAANNWYWMVDGVKVTPRTVTGIKARANGKYVTAGASPLIASQTAVGTPERFAVVDLGNGDIALHALVNGMLVTAETAGAAALVANRTAIGPWERFELIGNSDGTVSLKARVNGKYVTAENAGASPLIANRDAIGLWEKFDLVG
ncbi:alkaline phosphatase family protein [Actinokineospora sp. HUAS TT18]|uniref:alkaline phosphatase family protein n=1 Tax=Actinokineospora sp. HUAS TT18 TaxID=3447451 RepID=UPI003F525406